MASRVLMIIGVIAIVLFLASNSSLMGDVGKILNDLLSSLKSL